ncbi:MAG: HAMP domain-containing protein [Steroidobacteraceae bacterium]|nr:HAMP domain-containing protein [Steroidobacteraceae bacterium]MCC7198006.1 HAMP domain-containing protein [Gammaproteobacteria bacterium]
MDRARLISRWPMLLGGAGLALWLVALGMLAVTAQNSEQFGRLHPWILMVNVAGLAVLIALLAGRLFELVRDFRRNVPGSRLKARTVMMFGGLAVAPILVVFAFSIVFLTRGIDSWFHVEVKQGLSDALGLSRAALDLRMREYVDRTTRISEDLGSEKSVALFSRLDTHRRLADANELAVIGSSGRMEAFSTDIALTQMPAQPAHEALVQVWQGQPFVSLDPAPDGGYVIRTAVRLEGEGGLGNPRVLIAAYPVPQRLAALADTVQTAYQQYGRLSYLREPLKVSFTLTLSLVLLMALLAAVYGAFFFSEKLVRPVQDLIAGTRAVAKGDYDTQLELPSRDEMGLLVSSFNDMARRLARARAEAARGQQAVEAERAKLAAILARLSTGVISLEPTLEVRVANQAAGLILGVDLERAEGRPLDEVAAGSSLAAQFVEAVRRHLSAGQTEWREQLTLNDAAGRRELMCACTALVGDGGLPGGLVVVFDDITTLLQAQREAAWGEVARRLAHEIKNPLTPIQLSAERMRRKLLGGLGEREAELLDRATHTIVQQVEAMKQMVNAFSEYARAPEMRVSAFDLNALVAEVADLYRAQDTRARLALKLDPAAAGLEADRGRIRQVLNNLLTNAFEALEGQPDGEVTIETRAESPGVEITVTDNGPGFQRELVSRVFDPYVTSKPKGTGLGLAIVRKITEEHGGRIEADNTPSGGARVRVWLPADDGARGAGSRELRRAETRRERA